MYCAEWENRCVGNQIEMCDDYKETENKEECIEYDVRCPNEFVRDHGCTSHCRDMTDLYNAAKTQRLQYERVLVSADALKKQILLIKNAILAAPGNYVEITQISFDEKLKEFIPADALEFDIRYTFANEV